MSIQWLGGIGKLGDLVSIIVPVFNTEKWLSRCIESLINQTYRNIEILIVDDGSSDGSLVICKRYENADDRIIVLHQENKGVSAARNIALKRVKGDYIAFCDSDDWVEPGWIENQLAAIWESDADIAMCHCVLESNNAVIENVQQPNDTFDRDAALHLFIEHKYLNGTLCNKLFRKDVIKGLFLDERIRIIEDDLFFFFALQRTGLITLTGRLDYHYNVGNSNSACHSMSPNRIRDPAIVWKEIHDNSAACPKEFTKLAKERYLSFLCSGYRLFCKSDMTDDYYIAFSKLYDMAHSSGLKCIFSLKSPKDIISFLLLYTKIIITV